MALPPPGPAGRKSRRFFANRYRSHGSAEYKRGTESTLPTKLLCLNCNSPLPKSNSNFSPGRPRKFCDNNSKCKNSYYSADPLTAVTNEIRRLRIKRLLIKKRLIYLREKRRRILRRKVI